jgi:hypothetical protein
MNASHAFSSDGGISPAIRINGFNEGNRTLARTGPTRTFGNEAGGSRQRTKRAALLSADNYFYFVIGGAGRDRTAE